MSTPSPDRRPCRACTSCTRPSPRRWSRDSRARPRPLCCGTTRPSRTGGRGPMVYQRNMSRVGYADLDGRSGFKLAMKEHAGRFYLYVAALWEPGLTIIAATTLPGFTGHIYAVIDIDDPADPRVVGRWWYPGQHTAAGESFSPTELAKNTGGRPATDLGIFLHGGPYRSGDRVYCPWARGGLVILDISDVTAPRLVSTLSVYPPVPLPDRDLVLINDEALNERRGDPANYAGVVDVSDEREPVLVSLFPVPEPPPGAAAG